MSEKTDVTEPELGQMADEIATLETRGDWTRSALLKDMYVARVWEKRQSAGESLAQEVALYLGRPEIRVEHRCLMDVCDDDLMTATRYVLGYMMMAHADGFDLNIERAAQEVERCFSRLTDGDARLRV